MAFGAVTILMDTLHQHFLQPAPRFPLRNKTKVKSLYRNLSSLQTSLEQDFKVGECDEAAIKALEAQMRDVSVELRFQIEHQLTLFYLGKSMKLRLHSAKKLLPILRRAREDIETTDFGCISDILAKHFTLPVSRMPAHINKRVKSFCTQHPIIRCCKLSYHYDVGREDCYCKLVGPLSYIGSGVKQKVGDEQASKDEQGNEYEDEQESEDEGESKNEHQSEYEWESEEEEESDDEQESPYKEHGTKDELESEGEWEPEEEQENEDEQEINDEQESDNEHETKDELENEEESEDEWETEEEQNSDDKQGSKVEQVINNEQGMYMFSLFCKQEESIIRQVMLNDEQRRYMLCEAESIIRQELRAPSSYLYKYMKQRIQARHRIRQLFIQGIKLTSYIKKELLKLKNAFNRSKTPLESNTASLRGSEGENITVGHSLQQTSMPTIKMVGCDDEFNMIMEKLNRQSSNREIFSIVGMGGSGKTTLARKIYEDASFISRFDCRAWVTISHEYNPRQVFQSLLHSLAPGVYENNELVSEYTNVSKVEGI